MLLIESIIAASVVDFPDPVGPVTSTRPCGQVAPVDDRLGHAELLERRDLFGMSRSAIATDRRVWKALARMRCSSPQSNAKSTSCCSEHRVPQLGREDLADEVLDLLGRVRGLVARLDRTRRPGAGEGPRS